MIHLDFPGMKPAAKARPRYDSRGGFMHMPQRYVDWKHAFVVGCVGSEYWQINSGPLTLPVAVSVVFRTATGNMRPDIDNAAGSCLDALQDAGIIANDGLVRRLSAEVVKVPRKDVGISVSIEQI